MRWSLAGAACGFCGLFARAFLLHRSAKRLSINGKRYLVEMTEAHPETGVSPERQSYMGALTPQVVFGVNLPSGTDLYLPERT